MDNNFYTLYWSSCISASSSSASILCGQTKFEQCLSKPNILRLQPSNYQTLECKLVWPHFGNRWSDLSVLGRIFVMKLFYLRTSAAKYPKFLWLKKTQHFSTIIMEVFYCTCSCGHLKLCVHKYTGKCLKLEINCCFRASVWLKVLC